ALQPGRDGRRLLALLLEDIETSRGAPSVVEDAMVVGVLPAQQRGAGRAAQRIAREDVAERNPAVADQALELGHHPDRLGVEVVRDDEDDVRLGPRRGGRRERRALRLLAAAPACRGQNSSDGCGATGHGPIPILERGTNARTARGDCLHVAENEDPWTSAHCSTTD